MRGLSLSSAVVVLTLVLSSFDSGDGENADHNLEYPSGYLQLIKPVQYCLRAPRDKVRDRISKIRLRFYYRANDYLNATLEDADKLLNSMHWKVSTPFALFLGGYLIQPDSPILQRIIQAYTSKPHLHNFILVEWNSVVIDHYNVSVSLTPYAGKAIARAVDKIIEAGAKLDHIAGHSLGAQAAGQIARSMINDVPHVIGLDPAGPLFDQPSCQTHISKSDAQYVEIVHSSLGMYGTTRATGSVDFYPNGGIIPQPDCLLKNSEDQWICSHELSLYIWEENISSPSSRPFVGRKCESYFIFHYNFCNEEETQELGQISSFHIVYVIEWFLIFYGITMKIRLQR